MKSLAICAALALVSSVASAASFEVTSGNYMKGMGYYSDGGVIQVYEYPGYTPSPAFKIVQKANQIRLVDTKTNIVYSLDLNNPGEQELPASYLEFLRTSSKVTAFAPAIKRIFVSGVSVVGEGQMRGDLIVEIEHKSIFGTLSAKIKLGSSASARACDVIKTKQQGQVRYTGTCIKAKTAQTVDIVEIETGLSPEFNRAVGLIADIFLKASSLAWGEREVDLWETR